MQLKDLETPALIVDLDILEQNMSLAQTMADRAGFALRPHYKSHKCTAIAHWQVAAGAKGITCAKLDEAVDLAESGIEDILIANEITDRAKLARLASLAKCCRLTVCVDQAENIDALEAAAAAQDAVIHVMVEYDVGLNRCGLRDAEEFVALAKRVAARPHLTFEGIHAYAGQLSHEVCQDARTAASAGYEAELKALKERVEAAGLPVRQVSGVSTGTITLREQGTVYTEAEVGSYLFMDASYQQLQLPFRNSLFLLTSVISMAGGLIITDAGCKSLGMDQEPAVFSAYPDAAVNFSEEHASIPQQGREAHIGDKLRMIPGHSCTTFNMHDYVYLFRGDRIVDKLPITSRGRSK